MAWNIAEWKRVYGRGGAWASVLVVAGLIGVASRNWFDDPAGDPWFNARAAAEIVAGAMERERIVVDGPATNWAPSAVVDNYLTGVGYTNVLDPTVQRQFFADLRPDQYMATDGARRWVDLWDGADPEAYFAGAARFDPLAAGNAYMMGEAWWTSNILDEGGWPDGWDHPGQQFYPATNSWVLGTNLLHAVGRSMTACRWTIERAVSVESMELSVLLPDAEFSGEAFGWGDEAWNDLFFDAMLDLIVDRFEGDTAFTTNGAAIQRHYGSLYWWQSATNTSAGDPGDRYQRVVMVYEYVNYEMPPRPTVYMGTPTNAFGVGMLEFYDQLAGAPEGFRFHYGPDTASGRSASTAMETTDCTAVVIDGATHYRNDLAAWDGFFFAGAFTSDAQFPGPPTNEVAIERECYFGWYVNPTNQAVVIEWQLEHMTNHAAFWP